MKKVLPLILAIGLLLVACGPNETPGPSQEQVLQTAVAMASTMSALTAAAQPSPTPPPPSPTATLPPPASPTTFALPTFPSVQPTATTAASGGACNSLMAPDPSGPKVYVVIDNQTKGSLVFSLYLNETAFACGFVRGVSNIGPRQKVGVTIPEGCYFPSVYINGLAKDLSFAGPTACIHGSDKITLLVTESGMRWQFP